MDKQTSKVCPNCGNTHLVCIGSYELKHCTDCNTSIPWYRDADQPSALGETPAKRDIL